MANIESASLFPILPNDPPEMTLPRGIARLACGSAKVDSGHQVEFRSLSVRSILNHSVSKRWLTVSKSINPYRGCEFACRYCYARYTHEFMELRNPADFERKIFVKQNAAWLLQQELRNLRPGEYDCDRHGDRSLPADRAEGKDHSQSSGSLRWTAWTEDRDRHKIDAGCTRHRSAGEDRGAQRTGDPPHHHDTGCGAGPHS